LVLGMFQRVLRMAYEFRLGSHSGALTMPQTQPAR
jgi:hypothetical protein